MTPLSLNVNTSAAGGGSKCDCEGDKVDTGDKAGAIGRMGRLDVRLGGTSTIGF